MTPKEQKAIEQFAAGRKIELAEWNPEEWAKYNQCFANAAKKVKLAGEMTQAGYAFFRFDSDIMKAFSHVIWQSPDGRLVDVSPFNCPEGTYVVSINGRNLFVLEPSMAAVQLLGEWSTARGTTWNAGDFCCPPGRLLPLNRKARKYVAVVNQGYYASERTLRTISVPAIAI